MMTRSPIKTSKFLSLVLRHEPDRIGLTLAFAFHRGNLGPLDLQISFKPPNGLGMSLDAGLVSGGGYLFIDQQRHRYAGVLECSIADIIQVKIIGVLDTVLPDGSNGFSLLLVITRLVETRFCYGSCCARWRPRTSPRSRPQSPSSSDLLQTW